MGKVILDMSMSLDGFVSGPNGEDAGLHDYFFSPSDASAQVIEEGIETTGAIVMGRRTYEIGASQDGFMDNPYQMPHFVLTHDVPETVVNGAESFIFVTNGIESALQQVLAAVGDKHVVIGSGANIAQQYLRAGLVDEIQVHLVPVLLGAGIRLFEHLEIGLVKLEYTRVVDAPGVTHLRFRMVSDLGLTNRSIDQVIDIYAPAAKVWRVFTDSAVTRQMGGEYVSDWNVGVLSVFRDWMGRC